MRVLLWNYLTLLACSGTICQRVTTLLGYLVIPSIPRELCLTEDLTPFIRFWDVPLRRVTFVNWSVLPVEYGWRSSQHIIVRFILHTHTLCHTCIWLTSLSTLISIHFHPFPWKFYDALVFHSWIVSYCVDELHFHYPFLSWGTSRLFPVSGYLLLWTSLSRCLCGI